MATASWKYPIVNSFGTLGYISVIIQWTWCFITLGQQLLSADRPLLLPQAPVSPASQTIDFGIFSPFVSLLALFITVLVVALTIITLIRLPKTVGKSGSKATHVIATQIVKKTLRHHPMPAKKRKKFSFWIIWLLKLIAISIPFALVFITPSIEGLSTRLITTVGLIGAVFSTSYFAVQLLLSFILKLDKKKIW